MSRQTGMLKEMITQFKLCEPDMATQIPDSYWAGKGSRKKMNALMSMNDDHVA